MKTHRTFKKVTALFLVLALASVAFAPAAYAFDESCLMEGFRLTQEGEYKLIGGVSEKHYVLNDSTDSTQIRAFTMEVDLSDPTVSIIAGYNDGDTDEWSRALVMAQAEAMQAKRGVHVIGAINGDFYDHVYGKPRGPLVMSGVECNPGCYSPYFAILNDGTAVIRDAGVSTADCAEAIGGGPVIIRNGKITTSDNSSRQPRTAVGIKADGTVVLFVADGRQDPDSCGMYIEEIAHTMLAMGCVQALNLDGGGSTTFLSQREGSESLEVNNSPCYLTERAVSSTLMVCTTVEPTGIFDHIAFSNCRYECAPYSVVITDYAAVDTNGYAVKAPSGGKLVLSDDSYGILIDRTFKAGSKQGDVTLDYMIDGVSYGSAVINVDLFNDTFGLTLLRAIVLKVQTLIHFFEYAMSKIFGDAID